MRRARKISASCQGRPKKASAPGPLQRDAEPVFGDTPAAAWFGLTAEDLHLRYLREFSMLVRR